MNKIKTTNRFTGEVVEVSYSNYDDLARQYGQIEASIEMERLKSKAILECMKQLISRRAVNGTD